MSPQPITNRDVYKATLAACLKAESSDQHALAQVLRAWVDISPFSRCMKCGLRVVRPIDPPCEQCNGDGFVPRMIRPRSGARKPATGKFATRAELVADIWRRRASGESRKIIAESIGVSESTVSKVIDSKEGEPSLPANQAVPGPMCHFRPMQLVVRGPDTHYECTQCGHQAPVSAVETF